MKKLISSIFVILLFTACEKQDKRYTQQSPEIETVKKLIDNYNNKVYDITVYADSSKTFFNSKTPMSPRETIAQHQERDAMYSKRGFTDEDPEYEMVITDDGETWVNCWLNWKGTLAANNKEFEMPVHLTYRFVDVKIVREVAMFDPSAIVLELQDIDAKNNIPDFDKKITNNVNLFIDEFHNKKNTSVLKDVITNDYVRYMNGAKSAKNPEELVASLNAFFTGFPDLKIKLLNTYIKGKDMFIEWEFTGTNTGKFGDYPATGKKAKMEGLSLAHFDAEGKMNEEYIYFNELELMQQLGHKLAQSK
jgi:steroid delta-isomerase-like uncharacterized protein